MHKDERAIVAVTLLQNRSLNVHLMHLDLRAYSQHERTGDILAVKLRDDNLTSCKRLDKMSPSCDRRQCKISDPDLRPLVKTEGLIR
jgi:hypothetical protein